MIEDTDRALLARLERSRVVIGDCVLYHEDAGFILPTLHSIDAVVTDPPYGIDAAGRGTIGSGSKDIPPPNSSRTTGTRRRWRRS